MCGERFSRNRVCFSYGNHTDNISQTFGVLCGDDSPDIHPPLICHGCFSVWTRSKKVVEVGKQYHHSVEAELVTAQMNVLFMHEHFQMVSTGGQPKKGHQNPGISIMSVTDHTVLQSKRAKFCFKLLQSP